MPPDRRPAIGLFAKPVVPGLVKTRLVPPLTHDGAARLYAGFLADLADTLNGGPWDWTVFSTEPGGQRATWPVNAPLPARLHPQSGADLGERMHRAFEALLHGGAAPSGALIVGSDHPTLSRRTLVDACAALTGADLVLGPAEDGGYTLIGLREPAAELFTGIAWSTASVLAATLERADTLGMTVALLPPEADVDTPEDLDALLERLRGDDQDALPAAPSSAGLATCVHTRRALRELGLLRSRTAEPG